MKTQSIVNIANSKQVLEETLKNYKVATKKAGYKLGDPIGHENEFTISNMIAGINNLLIDITYLLRASNIFLKLSTLNERNNINSSLTQINSYIANYQFMEAINVLESLKVIIRSFNLVNDKERLIEYIKALDGLRGKAEEMDLVIQNIREHSNEADDLYESIMSSKTKHDTQYSELITKRQELEKEITEAKQKYSELNGLITISDNYTKQILDMLNTATSNDKTIQTFSENVSKRENQLKEQQIKTDEYNEKLAEYNQQHNSILSEAKGLIANAREALRLKTAEGISAAFSNQYDIANDIKSKIGWLVGSIAFLFFTIALGAWVVGGWFIEDPENIRNILGRIALLPLSLLGTLFCANQYVKQKNIAEDYAYKTVLAKSIVGFSDELKESPDAYKKYISTVLDEIHQDPLRKRGKDEKDIESNLNVLKKMLQLLKQTATE